MYVCILSEMAIRMINEMFTVIIFYLYCRYGELLIIF